MTVRKESTQIGEARCPRCNRTGPHIVAGVCTACDQGGHRGSPTPYYDADGITIYHGDCRDILPTLQLAAAAVVTDPPYGIDYASEREGSAWRGEAIANDATTDARDWVVRWALERSCSALMFGTWRVPHPDGTRAVLIWDKGPASGMGDLAIPWKTSWEEIYVIGRAFEGHRGEGVLKGHNVVTSASRGRNHPNEKPVTLMQALIQKVPASVLIDPFMGSGSTLRAALNLSRRAIGIEVDRRWCDVAIERLGQTVMDFGEAA